MTVSSDKDIFNAASGLVEKIGSTLCLSAKAPLQALYDFSSSPYLLRCTLAGPLSWQQRNGITVEEAVLSPNLAPQWVAALLALGTTVTLSEGEGSLSDFLRRALLHSGKLAELKVPVDVSGQAWGEAHVGRTPADQPIVSAIAVVNLEAGVVRQVRLALTGTWREHARLVQAAEKLIDQQLNQELIQEVAAIVMEEVTPPDDFLGSAEYRRAMAGVLTRRALEQCLNGANPQ